jgi:hypothetical protein
MPARRVAPAFRWLFGFGAINRSDDFQFPTAHGAKGFLGLLDFLTFVGFVVLPSQRNLAAAGRDLSSISSRRTAARTFHA